MAVILDTDHLIVIQRRTWPPYGRLHARLSKLPRGPIHTTIISFEEQMRGWLSVISRARSSRSAVDAYSRLAALLRFFGEVAVLDFTDSAAMEFEKLNRSKLSVGSMDLKIASIALSGDHFLLSSNLKDFQRISNLRVEDWTL